MKKTNQSGFGLVEGFILLVVIILLVFGGWYIWQASQKQASSTQPTTSDTFKVPELGIEFDIKNNIKPLYKVVNYTSEGKIYQAVDLSTQQLVDRGASVAASENACMFLATNGQNVNFSLIDIRVFDAAQDLLKVEAKNFGQVTDSDIQPQNGFFTIEGKIYHVPQQMEAHQGNCLTGNNTEFETEQRSFLLNSLMTLRAIK